MDKTVELLRAEIKKSSMGKVAQKLGVSKSTVSLVSRHQYPNPQKVLRKVKEIYGGANQEIIGAETNKSAAELLKELG